MALKNLTNSIDPIEPKAKTKPTAKSTAFVGSPSQIPPYQIINQTSIAVKSDVERVIQTHPQTLQAQLSRIAPIKYPTKNEEMKYKIAPIVIISLIPRSVKTTLLRLNRTDRMEKLSRKLLSSLEIASFSMI